MKIRMKFGTGKSNSGISILPALCVDFATTTEGKRIGFTIVCGWLSHFLFLVVVNSERKLDVVSRENVLQDISVHSIH